MAWGFNPYLIGGRTSSPALISRWWRASAQARGRRLRPRATPTSPSRSTSRRLRDRARALGQAHGRRARRARWRRWTLAHRRHRRQGLHDRQFVRGQLDVPPTLVSLRRRHAARPLAPPRPSSRVRAHRVVCIAPAEYGRRLRPNATGLLEAFDVDGEARSATVRRSPSPRPATAATAEALFKMCVGNQHRRHARRGQSPPTACSTRLTAASSWSSPTAPSCPPRLTRAASRSRHHDRGLRVRGRRRDLSTWRRCRRRGRATLEARVPLPHQGRDRRTVDAIDYQCQAASTCFSGAKLGRAARDSSPSSRATTASTTPRAPSSAPAPTPDVFVINNLTPADVAESTARALREAHPRTARSS